MSCFLTANWHVTHSPHSFTLYSVQSKLNLSLLDKSITFLGPTFFKPSVREAYLSSEILIACFLLILPNLILWSPIKIDSRLYIGFKIYCILLGCDLNKCSLSIIFVLLQNIFQWQNIKWDFWGFRHPIYEISILSILTFCLWSLLIAPSNWVQLIQTLLKDLLWKRPQPESWWSWLGTCHTWPMGGNDLPRQSPLAP